jgi:hypothetical protein
VPQPPKTLNPKRAICEWLQRKLEDAIAKQKEKIAKKSEAQKGQQGQGFGAKVQGVGRSSAISFIVFILKI